MQYFSSCSLETDFGAKYQIQNPKVALREIRNVDSGKAVNLKTPKNSRFRDIFQICLYLSSEFENLCWICFGLRVSDSETRIGNPCRRK